MLMLSYIERYAQLNSAASLADFGGENIAAFIVKRVLQKAPYVLLNGSGKNL
jgi:hypothetical protein